MGGTKRWIESFRKDYHAGNDRSIDRYDAFVKEHGSNKVTQSCGCSESVDIDIRCGVTMWSEDEYRCTHNITRCKYHQLMHDHESSRILLIQEYDSEYEFLNDKYLAIRGMIVPPDDTKDRQIISRDCHTGYADIYSQFLEVMYPGKIRYTKSLHVWGIMWKPPTSNINKQGVTTRTVYINPKVLNYANSPEYHAMEFIFKS